MSSVKTETIIERKKRKTIDIFTYPTQITLFFRKFSEKFISYRKTITKTGSRDTNVIRLLLYISAQRDLHDFRHLGQALLNLQRDFLDQTFGDFVVFLLFEFCVEAVFHLI